MLKVCPRICTFNDRVLSSAPANMHYLRLHFLLHALQSAKTEQIDVEPSLYINVKTYRKPLMNILIMRSRDVVVPPLALIMGSLLAEVDHIPMTGFAVTNHRLCILTNHSHPKAYPRFVT